MENNLFDSQASDTGLVTPAKIFSLEFNGRYGRLNYVRAYCLISLAGFLALFVSAFLGPLGALLGFAFGLFAIVLNVRIGILRLHDLNKSGWLMLLILLPIVNFIFLLFLLFAPGTPGSNKYGAQTVPSSAVYAIVLVVLVLMGIGMSGYVMSQMENELYMQRVIY